MGEGEAQSLMAQIDHQNVAGVHRSFSHGTQSQTCALGSITAYPEVTLE